MNLDKKNLSNFVIAIVLATLLSTMLSGCAYSDKFSCHSAKGLNCQMLRVIDKKIDSGEIDKTYKAYCTGKKCKMELDEVVIPQNEPIKATLNSPHELEEIIIEVAEPINLEEEKDA